MAVTTVNSFGNLNQSILCVHCNHQIAFSARFCGECGAPSAKSKSRAPQESFAASFKKTQTVLPPHMPQAAAMTAQASKSSTNALCNAAPNFAKVGKKRKITPEMQIEMATLICSLARERMFLFFHCSVFLSVNAFGLYLAFTAYHGFIGDEVTKTIMAMTPMMFINTVALACLSPIKGTNREIARIKERLKFMKSKIEYANLF